MADDIELNLGTGGAVVAADDVSSVYYQRVKLDGGGNGVAVPIIAGRRADAASVPVALSDEDVAMIDGLETAIASTNTKLDTVITALGTIDGRVDGLETLVTATNSKLDTENTNSTAAAASLSVADDWDETNRAAVNTIAGQVGVQGASGTVNALTQRVVLATDVNIPLGGALLGPGNPVIDSFTSAAINVGAASNTSIITAPGANKQIWIYGLAGTANVAGSVSLQDEDDTAITGVMPVGITGGWVLPMSGNFAMPWKKVATNKAVELDTVTCEFDGIITYAIVSV